MRCMHVSVSLLQKSEWILMKLPQVSKTLILSNSPKRKLNKNSLCLVVFHQPLWKILQSQNGNLSPNFRDEHKKKYLSCHHLDLPEASSSCFCYGFPWSENPPKNPSGFAAPPGGPWPWRVRMTWSWRRSRPTQMWVTRGIDAKWCQVSN